MKMSELTDIGMDDNSPSLGECLSKYARHHLCLICLEGIREEFQDKPMSHKSRGRPVSTEYLLATTLSVSRKTVKRWATSPDVDHNIQSCDSNAERLAELAYRYDPEKTTKILREDLMTYQKVVESWLDDSEAKYGTGPYPLMQPLKVQTPAQEAE